MINQETGLDYARFDHSDTRIRQAQYRHKPSWRGAWLYCLKHFDYEAADLIKSKQMISDECVNGGCEDCAYLWCCCSRCRSANQFKLEHPQIRSLAEVEGEREEEIQYALG